MYTWWKSRAVQYPSFMAYPVTFWRTEIIQLHKRVDIRKCFSSTGYIVKLWRLSHYLKFRQYTSEPKYPSTQTVLWVDNTIVLSWLSYILPKSWRVHYKLPPLYSVVLGTSFPQSCILYALLATDKKSHSAVDRRRPHCNTSAFLCSQPSSFSNWTIIISVCFMYKDMDMASVRQTPYFPMSHFVRHYLQENNRYQHQYL